MMSYRFFCLLLGSYMLLHTCYGQQPRSEERPNILWIVSEDNSPLLGCYGDTFATTPVLDHFASQGVLYELAFATAPVCAPSRSTLITGVYPPSMGTQHMRSTNPIPEFIHFFPHYLRQAGYYCTNNAKKDYNTLDQPDAWDESSRKATYKNRAPGQPFFAVFNQNISHESSIHKPQDSLRHDPQKVPIPPYHPRTPEMEHDWAQYYDKVEMMDQWVGSILQELEEQGLAESTIVFYYSDHGGVLGRSKRFMYESGLRVPLIIRFPEKYRHLAPSAPGSRSQRLVSFLDFAPTVLSLAGVDIPAYMQGTAFLGPQAGPPRQYAYSFRGRMDEVFDMSRGLREARFRYTRNYLPHRIYGQYLEYLWRAPSMRSWEAAYRRGELNAQQSAFWRPKPVEELYDCLADPHNVYNLAGDTAYQEVLLRMRQANRDWLLQSRDAGFLPEADMIRRAGDSTIYAYTHSRAYRLEYLMETAEMAGEGKPEYLPELLRRMQDEDPAVRYWAVTGCVILGEAARPALPQLTQRLEDAQPHVAIAAAEALYGLGEKEAALQKLAQAISFEPLMARVHAFNVLRLTGPDARLALPRAKALLQGVPDTDRRYDYRAARYLIRQLEGR